MMLLGAWVPYKQSARIILGSASPPLAVKATPRQKAIHYLHTGQQRSKQKELSKNLKMLSGSKLA
jgi:hypothetical protein